jgi:hypothetical protein
MKILISKTWTMEPASLATSKAAGFFITKAGKVLKQTIRKSGTQMMISKKVGIRKTKGSSKLENLHSGLE